MSALFAEAAALVQQHAGLSEPVSAARYGIVPDRAAAVTGRVQPEASR